MPATPRVAPYPPMRPQGISVAEPSTPEHLALQPTPSHSPAATVPPRITLSNDIIAQTIKSAMRLVTRELFGRGAMTIDKHAKKVMLCKVISDSVPRCFAPNGSFPNTSMISYTDCFVSATFEEFITANHMRDVANALSVTRGKFVEFARDGVFSAYRLFPPQHSTTPPKVYRQRVIKKITTEADELVFMHIYTFDQVISLRVFLMFNSQFCRMEMLKSKRGFKIRS